MSNLAISTGRDYQTIIELFAQGLKPEEVSEQVRDELGRDFSTADARRFAKRNADAIAVYTREHSDTLLRKVQIAHKSIRVGRVESLCEQLEQGIAECSATGRWNQAAKLADTILKAYRLVGEETHDLTKPMQGANIYIQQLIQVAPPEQRPQVLEQVKALEAKVTALIDEGMEDIRRSIGPTKLGEVVDGDFVVEPGDNADESPGSDSRGGTGAVPE